MVKHDQEHCSRAKKYGKAVEIVIGNHFACGRGFGGGTVNVQLLSKGNPGSHVMDLGGIVDAGNLEMSGWQFLQ